MPPNSNTPSHLPCYTLFFFFRAHPETVQSSSETIRFAVRVSKAFAHISRTFFFFFFFFFFLSYGKAKEVVEERLYREEYVYPRNDDGMEDEEEREKRLGKACEVYVCNLPRRCDAAYLLDMFMPYGTILSVEVCRHAETNESKGCGYVTLGSIYSARNAVAALDGSDVGGRELRVRFSIEMNSKRRSFNKMNSSTKRIAYYQSPHKLYVGNLAKTVRPEQLRDLFSRFGNVVSARVFA